MGVEGSGGAKRWRCRGVGVQESWGAGACESEGGLGAWGQCRQVPAPASSKYSGVCGGSPAHVTHG